MNLKSKTLTWEGPFYSETTNQNKYYIANVGMINPITIEAISDTMFYSNTPWGFVTGDSLQSVQDAIQAHLDNFVSQNAFNSDEIDLEEEMKQAGMIPLKDIIEGNVPTQKYITHTGVTELQSFADWLERKREQCLRMRIKQEFDRNDELYDFLLGKASAYEEIYQNFRKATK